MTLCCSIEILHSNSSADWGYTTADSIHDSFEAASSIIVRRNVQNYKQHLT